MGYDSNVEVKVIQKDLLPDQQKSYEAEVKKFQIILDDLGQKIEHAKSDLSVVNQQINSAKEDAEIAASQRIQDTNNQIQIIGLQIDDLNKKKADVEQQIAEKIIVRNTLLDGLALGRDRLAIDQNDLADRMVSLRQEQDQFTMDQIVFRQKQEDFATSQKTLMDSIQNKQKELDARETALTIREEKQDQIKNDLFDQQANLLISKTELDQMQKDLETKLSAAQPLIEQASKVQEQVDSLDARKVELDAQEQRNQDDVVQIQVAKKALENQKADIIRREQAVKAAEIKIGG